MSPPGCRHPAVAAWAAFLEQVDPAATRSRVPVSARDVGCLSPGSAARFALFQGARRGRGAGDEQIARGGGGARPKA